MSSIVSKSRREYLGAMGLVLLPLQKLKNESPRGTKFELEVHDFLVENFNGYTVASGNISGHWKDSEGNDFYGEHREYRVALPESEAIQSLESYIAILAREMAEECIYFELAGQTSLIYASAL
jgi:hypothetical protein